MVYLPLPWRKKLWAPQLTGAGFFTITTESLEYGPSRACPAYGVDGPHERPTGYSHRFDQRARSAGPKEVFERILHMTGNAGATEEHRAVNYLAMLFRDLCQSGGRTCERFFAG